jgi:hypothetical protein
MFVESYQPLRVPVSDEPEMRRQSRKRKREATNENIGCSINRYKDAALDQEIKNHAYQRVHDFYLKVIVYHRKGCRTEMPPSHVEFYVGSSRLQKGISHRPEYHAAHHNAASGITDNIKMLYRRQITQEGKITPQKARLFKAKGLTEAQLKAVEDSGPQIDQNLLKDLLKKAFKDNLSIIEATELNDTINTTTVLPRAVNLGPDKSLENALRKAAIPQLLSQVAKDEITPEKATKKFVKKAKEHFEEKMASLQERLGDLKLKKLTNANQQAITKLETKIHFYQLEIEGTQLPDFNQLIGKYDEQQQQLLPLNDEEKENLSYSLLQNKNTSD